MSFPLVFRGGAFVDERESWNRYRPNHYRVVFMHFVGGRPVGKPFPFATNFLDRAGNARGRPVGIAIDRTGALIVADDAGNAVWVRQLRRRPLTSDLGLDDRRDGSDRTH